LSAIFYQGEPGKLTGEGYEILDTSQTLGMVVLDYWVETKLNADVS